MDDTKQGHVNNDPKLEAPAPVIAVEDEIYIADDKPVADVPSPVEEVKDTIIPKPVATLEFDYSIPDTFAEDAISIAMPSTSDKHIKDKLSKTPNVQLLDSKDSAKWGGIAFSGMDMTTFKEAFVPTFSDQTADFRQTIMFNGTKLHGVQPKFQSKENENVKGERGALRLMSYMGLGTIFQAPMWHSGFWITFKAPTESELVELHRILYSDKLMFGRYTYGLAFSNITAYTVDRLTTFALEHVYETSIETKDELTVGYLRSALDIHDIPSVIWGLACTMFPKGFKFQRSCVDNPERCNHIEEARLNLTKLMWTNTAALTEWQKSHMTSRRANSMSPDSVRRYKEELLRTQNREITISAGTDRPLTMVLRTPNLLNYIDSGFKWIGGIVDVVDGSLGKDVNLNDRNAYIIKHGKATLMRQYAHWVQSIGFESNVIDDIDSIEQNLSLLSSDDNIREEFLEAISKYINESTISAVGIPAYDCPVCGAPQDRDLSLPKLVNIIPLDVITLFFGLLGQRLGKVEER